MFDVSASKPYLKRRRAFPSKQFGKMAYVPLLIIAALPYLIAILLAVAASFAVCFIFFRRQWRGFACVVIATGWCGLFYVKVLMPAKQQDAETQWRTGVWPQCERELNSLPKKVQTTGLLLPAPLLSERSIMDLLAQRRLSFVEVAVTTDGMLARANSESDSRWIGNTPPAPIARIMLESNSVGEPCTPETYSMKGLLHRAPYLPDTCVKVSYHTEPRSPLALTIDSAEAGSLGKYGVWKLVSREQNQVIAQLSTSATLEKYQFASHLSPIGAPKENRDCRSPQNELISLLVNESIPNDPRVLTEKKIPIRLDYLEPERRIGLKQVAATEEADFYTIHTKENSADFFNADSGGYPELWATAVQKATTQNYVAFGSRLIDWRNRQLIGADLSSTPKEHWAQKVFASDSGFLIANWYVDWRTNEAARIVGKFSPTGELLWALRIAPPVAQDDQDCKAFAPQAIQETSTTLRLLTLCTRSTSKQTGISWSIRKPSGSEFKH